MRRCQLDSRIEDKQLADISYYSHCNLIQYLSSVLFEYNSAWCQINKVRLDVGSTLMASRDRAKIHVINNPWSIVLFVGFARHQLCDHLTDVCERDIACGKLDALRAIKTNLETLMYEGIATRRILHAKAVQLVVNEREKEQVLTLILNEFEAYKSAMPNGDA